MDVSVRDICSNVNTGRACVCVRACACVCFACAVHSLPLNGCREVVSQRNNTRVSVLVVVGVKCAMQTCHPCNDRQHVYH